MNNSEPATPSDTGPNDPNHVDAPPGNHALEVAARRGLGPLSPAGQTVWHGHAQPCVSCGQLMARDAALCDHCGQDHSPEMLRKMRAHAGPWDVLEHVRPFPGVSLERIIRQVRRGLITETTIVRGPSTDFQWRFAVETPGLCRFFARCWKCHTKVKETHLHCRRCHAHLTFEKPRSSKAVASKPTAGQGSAAAGEFTVPSPQLLQLKAVVDRERPPGQPDFMDEPPRIAGVRATWLVAAILALVILLLLWLTRIRSDEPSPRTADASISLVVAD